MNGVAAVFKREFFGFFAALSSWLFLAAYVMLSGFLPLYAGAFYERGLADLQPFFYFQPFLLCLFMPAVASNAWVAEEKSGSLELLLTLPLSLFDLIVGKFAAHAAIALCGLILTFPTWRTVNALGMPDNAVIFAGYAAVFLCACCFLAVTLFFSVCSSHPASAFFAAMCVCCAVTGGNASFLEKMTGISVSGTAADILNEFNILTHYTPLTQGVIALKDILFFGLFTTFWLFSAGVALSDEKAGR